MAAGILFILLAALVYAALRLNYARLFNISAKAIRMQKPVILADGTVKRLPAKKLFENLAAKENALRRLAYKNTGLPTGEFFFNDLDMPAEYYLLMVYHKRTGTPLLTARYYLNNAAISSCLKSYSPAAGQSALDPRSYGEEDLLLIDRMCANKYNTLYRRHRAYIHLLFYAALLKHNKNRLLIAMARSQKFEKLRAKYLQLGLEVIGSAAHMGRQHWVLAGRLKTCYAQLNAWARLKITLASEILIFN